jgi:hypothetical protein
LRFKKRLVINQSSDIGGLHGIHQFSVIIIAALPKDDPSIYLSIAGVTLQFSDKTLPLSGQQHKRNSQ